MTKNDTSKEPSKTGLILFALAMIAVGVCMFIWPDLLDGADTSGRRALLKTIVVFVWGYVGGGILCLFGVLGIWGTLTDSGDSEESASKE